MSHGESPLVTLVRVLSYDSYPMSHTVKLRNWAHHLSGRATDFCFRSMVFKNSNDIDEDEDLSILSKEGLENRKYMQQLLQDRLALLPKNQPIKNQTF